MNVSPDLPDITSCEREPIHQLGRVQGFGNLIAVSSDWIVAHISRNAAELFGAEAEKIIGTRLTDWMPADTIHEIRTRMQMMAGEPARLFGIDVMGTGRLFDVGVHAAGSFSVIEMEAKRPGAEDRAFMIRPLISRISRRGGVGDLAEGAVRALKALTGFDRVMAYRFEPDWSGNVIAEAKEPDQEVFRGLRYPASDIPAQARELYRRSPLRLIEDVDGVTFDIHPAETAEGMPLDLSLAIGRAVSPIHLEYLRNMGVSASMSVSIMRGDRLWGLFACHHREPRYVDYELRTAVELFAQLFSYELANKEQEAAIEADQRARSAHDRLMTSLSSGGTMDSHFDTLASEIADAIPYDGIALWTEDGFRSHGSTPNEREMADLARFLNTAAASRIYATDRLGERYSQAGDIADRVSGILALPVSRSPRDYLVLFRRELRQEVSWGGEPAKAVERTEDGMRLTPRKSFAAWKEIVSGTSTPWTAAEQRVAEALRVTLLEVVLKLADEGRRIRERASEQQDLLVAELNHRVRNILNLIRGLVHQTQDGGAGTIESYVATLGGRIQSLAQAHDQLTAKTWGSVSLTSLILTEIDAFLAGKRDRITIDGDDVMVEPQAFTTLALVMHELVTNSAKYGALCDGAGRVSVSLSRNADGDLTIGWTERGGPPVMAPKRRGFGTTIIERSVPFELGGTASAKYRVTGLEARFVIPARFVSDAPVVTEAGADGAPGHGKRRGTGPDLSCVLLVEDNLIIALDATGFLEDLGAERVLTASTVRQALSLVQGEPVTVAVLDVNLGSETSQAVASALVDKGVPFVLATGYGSGELSEGAYPDVPVVKKPYDDKALRGALDAIS